MTLDQIHSSNINNNYSISQQDNETKVSNKISNNELISQEIINKYNNVDVDFSNSNRGELALEVKELLNHVKDQTMEKKEINVELENIQTKFTSEQSFAYDTPKDITKIGGSLSHAQANVSQAMVSKLLV
jgi:hypothetical protein